MKRILALVLLCMAVLAFSPMAPASDEIEDNVLVVVKEGEVMAFSGPMSHWVRLKLHATESIIETRASGNVAVVVTSGRVLGFSVTADRWNNVRLHADEIFRRVQASGNVATVETSLRVLGFSAKSGTWVEAE